MPTYSIRVREVVTKQGHGDFTVNASSEAEALMTIARAYRSAFAAGSSFVELPDGQHRLIESSETVNVIAQYFLVDEAGEIDRELTPREG